MTFSPPHMRPAICWIPASDYPGAIARAVIGDQVQGFGRTVRNEFMPVSFLSAYHAIGEWAKAQGISVSDRELAPEKAGQFDGLTATMNSHYDVQERLYYLSHALGSIVRWSLSRAAVQELFDELRAAKKERQRDRVRLERAVDKYRAFEIESSELAVWLLTRLGHEALIPSYTNFMRADLEALTEFHLVGRAPVWCEFFAHWNDEVARGQRTVAPFAPKAIPPFKPVHIENQEILQKQS